MRSTVNTRPEQTPLPEVEALPAPPPAKLCRWCDNDATTLYYDRRLGKATPACGPCKRRLESRYG